MTNRLIRPAKEFRTLAGRVLHGHSGIGRLSRGGLTQSFFRLGRTDTRPGKRDVRFSSCGSTASVKWNIPAVRVSAGHNRGRRHVRPRQRTASVRQRRPLGGIAAMAASTTGCGGMKISISPGSTAASVTAICLSVAACLRPTTWIISSFIRPGMRLGQHPYPCRCSQARWPNPSWHRLAKAPVAKFEGQRSSGRRAGGRGWRREPPARSWIAPPVAAKVRNKAGVVQKVPARYVLAACRSSRWR